METAYLDLLRDILANGTPRADRTGVGCRSVFGRQLRFDLSAGFPLLTTKRVYFHAVKVELLWFLRGDTNVRYLHDQGVTIWDEWAGPDGELGPVYGKQWRSWAGPDGRTIDQIANVIDQIRKSPESRRLVVSAWNPAEVADMALPPCHALFQFAVLGGKISCQLYQRSADVFLGVPFNIASYALLTHLIAKDTGLEVGEFVHTFGDVHIYDNHVDQVREQLTRSPRPFPRLVLSPAVTDVFAYTPDDIGLEAYDPWPAIKAPVAV